MRPEPARPIRTVVAVADGTEEMEAVICIDIFRRAGWDVTVAGPAGAGGTVTASRGVRLVLDAGWEALAGPPPDVLVIPGGLGGVEQLRHQPELLKAIRSQVQSDGWLASVCAGPLVLQEAGVLTDRRITCHPGVAPDLTTVPRDKDPVVVDGKLITSQGPGTCMDFALRVVAEVDGPDLAASLAEAMVCRSGARRSF